jgi:hypothetical protein
LSHPAPSRIGLIQIYERVGILQNVENMCTRLAAASDKVYQLLAHAMVGGSLLVFQLLPPLKLVVMI